jgi:hypothetical protein
MPIELGGEIGDTGSRPASKPFQKKGFFFIMGVCLGLLKRKELTIRNIGKNTARN